MFTKTLHIRVMGLARPCCSGGEIRWELSELASWRDGQFVQDALGQWRLCLPVQMTHEGSAASRAAVGVDLDLASLAGTSDGERLEAGTWYRELEEKIARALSVAGTSARPSTVTGARRTAGPTRCTSSLANWSISTKPSSLVM